MDDLIADLFKNPLRGIGLPAYIENIGDIGSISLIILGVIILSIVVFLITERKKKVEAEYDDFNSIPISNPDRKLAQYEKTSPSGKSEMRRAAVMRPSMDAVNKTASENIRIPLNEPMQIQVMISGLKAAEEFLFYLPVPAGTQRMGVKQLLYGNGKIWIRELDFTDFLLRRDRKTGNLLYNDRDDKWRVWNPLEEICIKGRSKQDWVMQFRMIRAK
ncbi:MAG: hypothetical protein LBB94_08425 [Clostridiales bacterium]|jgi:hypothetical protein|nr:hypothetical protein [Clostridiales bacterium]